jgi:hypothetical protein
MAAVTVDGDVGGETLVINAMPISRFYVGALGVSLPMSLTSEQLTEVIRILRLHLDNVMVDPDDSNIFWGLSVEKKILKTNDAIRIKLRQLGVTKAATGKRWCWLSAVERHPSKRGGNSMCASTPIHLSAISNITDPSTDKPKAPKAPFPEAGRSHGECV